MSEKEWEREKAVNLHLHLMQIYVQSVGVCVSPGDPPPTTCPTDTHRKMPVSIPGEETPLKSSFVPGETLGKRLPHWGKSKESQGELALGLLDGERGWAGLGVDPGFEGPEVHTWVRALLRRMGHMIMNTTLIRKVFT